MLEHKITTLIVAKSAQEQARLVEVLEKMPEISIISATTSSKKAIALILNYAPQLLFVNVELSDMSGLEFVEQLHKRYHFPGVVFIAPDERLAYDSLKLAPLDFIATPVDTEQIKQMIERLQNQFKREELKRKLDIYARKQDLTDKRVFLQKTGIIVLLLKEIIFCKSERAKTILTLTNGETVILKTGINETLETINNQLFFRIGRAYCINRNYLRKIDKKKSKCLMYFEGKSWELPASRSIINRLESLYTSPIY